MLLREYVLSLNVVNCVLGGWMALTWKCCNFAAALFVTTEDITKRLFLPMAGNLQGAYQNAKRDGVGTLCTYWSSSVYPSDPSLAQNFSVSTVEYSILRHHINLGRYFGFSIRPVAD